MKRSLPRTTQTDQFLVIPAAHAAEPSVTRTTVRPAAGAEEANRFSVLTAKRLAAALAAAAARPSPSMSGVRGRRRTALVTGRL